MEGTKIKEKVTAACLNPEKKMPGLYKGRSSPSGRSGLERGSPGRALSPAPHDSEGMEGPRQALGEAAGTGLRRLQTGYCVLVPPCVLPE